MIAGERTHEIAADLQRIGAAEWASLLEWCEAAAQESTEAATHPDTAEDKRAGWCGRAQGQRELAHELRELRDNSYRGWIEMRGLGEEDEGVKEPC